MSYRMPWSIKAWLTRKGRDEDPEPDLAYGAKQVMGINPPEVLEQSPV